MNDVTTPSPEAVPKKGNGGATLKDITGQRFGRLLVLIRDLNCGLAEAHWICACDCGNQTSQPGFKLRKGQVVSCGCQKQERWIRDRTKHGCTKHPLYKTWKAMMARCYRVSNNNYHSYGGRGISICERWHDPRNFITDMEPTYRPGLTIDRINVNGNYEPSNCRWSNKETQHNNTTRSVYLTAFGKTQSVQQWAREKGLNHAVISYRLRHGWTIKKTLSTPKGKRISPYSKGPQ